MRIALVDDESQTHIHPEAAEAVIECGDSLIIVRQAADFAGLRVEIKGPIFLCDNPRSIYDISLMVAQRPKGKKP